MSIEFEDSTEQKFEKYLRVLYLHSDEHSMIERLRQRKDTAFYVDLDYSIVIGPYDNHAPMLKGDEDIVCAGRIWGNSKEIFISDYEVLEFLKKVSPKEATNLLATKISGIIKSKLISSLQLIKN